MNIKKGFQIFGLLLLITSSACSTTNPQTVEVTRIMPQTVKVTRLMTQIVTPTSLPQEHPSASSTPGSPTTQETPFPRNQIYDQGIILVTQYYTFLGHGLYSEAYQLFSTAQQRHESEQEFIDTSKLYIKTIKIVTIQPVNEWITKPGSPWNPDPKYDMQFYVNTIPYGNGTMVGSAPSGIPADSFVTIKRENNDWKIDQIDTALKR
jgi:hypothetical protein